MKKRKSYSFEFQTNAVDLILNKGQTVAEVARQLNIDYSVLWRWKKKYTKLVDGNAGFIKANENNNQAIAELNAKLERITEERNILMKALSHFIAKQE